MLKIVSIPTLLFVLISSCKVSEKNSVGLYIFDQSPKTTLKINSDNTFEFSKINRNPYLHPFDQPDEYFSHTKGTWKIIGKKAISLTSQSDTMVYPLVSVDTLPARNIERSYFTFYDTYNDTVKILYVLLNDSIMVSAMHRSMPFHIANLTNYDKLEFHFYGYRPYNFINSKKLNQDFNIHLKPAFQPGFFKGTEFKIKHKQLIDIQRKRKFKLEKSHI